MALICGYVIRIVLCKMIPFHVLLCGAVAAAVWYSLLQFLRASGMLAPSGSVVLQCVAVCCSVLQFLRANGMLAPSLSLFRESLFLVFSVGLFCGSLLWLFQRFF